MFDIVKDKIDDVVFDLKYDRKELAKKAAKGAAIKAAELAIPSKRIRNTVKVARYAAKAGKKIFK